MNEKKKSDPNPQCWTSHFVVQGAELVSLKNNRVALVSMYWLQQRYCNRDVIEAAKMRVCALLGHIALYDGKGPIL
jgi:hypothetical protein